MGVLLGLGGALLSRGGALPAGGGAGALVPLGTYLWQRDEPEFGGFSALAITDHGQRMIAITDRGDAYTADIARAPAGPGGVGAMADLAQAHHQRLRDPKGKPLRPYLGDAEDMAIAPDGSLYVAFESYARILHYPSLAGLPLRPHPWDRFQARFGNLGFEALVVLPAGGVLAIAEVALPGVDEGADPPAFCYDGSAWRRVFGLPDPQGFAVSGADLGPDGRLYVLERKFLWYRGFSSRIRRFPLIATGGGGACALRPGPGETLLQTPFGALDNMEGISLWQAAGGQAMLTLISDDNFSWFQRTLLAEYAIAR